MPMPMSMPPPLEYRPPVHDYPPPMKTNDNFTSPPPVNIVQRLSQIIKSQLSSIQSSMHMVEKKNQEVKHALNRRER